MPTQVRFLLTASLFLLLAACVVGGEGENKDGGGSGPSTPSGVTATAGSGQVTLSWGATGTTGTLSYTLYMATQSGVTKSNTNTLAGGMTHLNVTSPYIHTGLTNGTRYYFVVTAVDGASESPESTEVSAVPTAADTDVTQFDGTYILSYSTTRTGGAAQTGTFTITAANGVITGIVPGGAGGGVDLTFSGTVAGSGAVTIGADGACVPTLTGQSTISSSGGAAMTGTLSEPVSATCDGSSGTWTATRTAVGLFNGTYTASLTGTRTDTGASVSSSFTLTATNGAVTGAMGVDTISGSVSSSGAITFTVPKNPTTGAPCDHITFTGMVTISSGSTAMTGAWSSPAGAIDPTGGTCPGFSGTWTATPAQPVNLTITHQGPNTGATGITPLGYVCNSTTPCVFSIPFGTVLTLSANVPATSTPGVFSNGTGSAAGCATSTCNFTMTTDSAVTTTFNQNLGPFPVLTITLAGTGTGDVDANNNTCQNSNSSGYSACSTAWASGSVVTLQATPAAGRTFGGFSGTCVGSATICTFTITNNSSVTATFN